MDLRGVPGCDLSRAGELDALGLLAPSAGLPFRFRESIGFRSSDWPLSDERNALGTYTARSGRRGFVDDLLNKRVNVIYIIETNIIIREGVGARLVRAPGP